MGLFLGISILSFLEIIELILKISSIHIKYRQKNQIKPENEIGC
jgi:hypothetical protein